jgi:hypothetical protein
MLDFPYVPSSMTATTLVLVAHCLGLHYYAQISHLMTDVQGYACYLPNAVILPVDLYGCETWEHTWEHAG